MGACGSKRELEAQEVIDITRLLTDQHIRTRVVSMEQASTKVLKLVTERHLYNKVSQMRIDKLSKDVYKRRKALEAFHERYLRQRSRMVGRSYSTF
jgi:hypothetical protein